MGKYSKAFIVKEARLSTSLSTYFAQLPVLRRYSVPHCVTINRQINKEVKLDIRVILLVLYQLYAE